MAAQWLTRLVGTEWTGRGELWLDPEGNNVDRCDCALQIETDALLLHLVVRRPEPGRACRPNDLHALGVEHT